MAHANETAPMCWARRSPSSSDFPRIWGRIWPGQSSVPLAPSSGCSAVPCPVETWAATSAARSCPQAAAKTRIRAATRIPVTLPRGQAVRKLHGEAHRFPATCELAPIAGPRSRTVPSRPERLRTSSRLCDRGLRMRAARCLPISVLAPAAALLLLGGDGKAASPPTGAMSSTSGPISWTYAPVVAGTLIDTGVEDVCPPGPCDNFDLTLSLPQPASTFYQANTATLSIHYTWTSSVPTDLDVFAFSPSGAKYGPGSPDDTSTGSGVEDLSITDPPNGVWHVRSV